MVIAELTRKIRAALHENAQHEAECIVCHALNISREQLIINSRRAVTPAECDKALALAARRINGEPLQYILGEAEFMSLGFFVREGVLIPRPDTETLVEYVLDETEDNTEYKILDICTGSGCIGISLAHYRKGVIADLIDISADALEVAARNIRRHGAEERVRTHCMDILEEYPKTRYDIIVSNPPYIETEVIDTLQTEVKDYEPRLALDGGADGLMFYRRIIEIAPKLLSKNGLLAFEIGYNQGEAVRSLMKGFYGVRVIKDLAGNDRVAAGRKE